MKLLQLVLTFILIQGPIREVWASPAMMGDGIERAPEKDHPALCRIDISIETDEGETEALCSGSLISENTVLTSAHCFPQNRNYSATVTCGGNWLGRVRRYELPPESDWLDPEHPSPTRDFARIQTRKRSRASPLSLSRSADTWFDHYGLLKESVSCRIAGFGMDSRGKSGHLLIGRPTGVEFWLEEGLIHMVPRSGWLKTSANPGDSGGPLLCHFPGMPEEIIGITEAYRFQDHHDQRIDNLFVPTWNLP